MNNNTYNPCPVNLDSIELPTSLDDLIEQIAENVHDVWAKSRMDEGWTYGPERNDEKKTHPCLVPYNQLPEIEKDYDRNTAINSIKLVIKLGYRIIQKE
jgi:hypothetical protein